MLEAVIILLTAAISFYAGWVLRGRNAPVKAPDLTKFEARLDAVEGLSRGVIRLLDDMKNQRAQQQAKTVEEVRAELGKMMGVKVDPEAKPARQVPTPSFGRTI